MKIAVLGTKYAGYVKPMMQGLERMLRELHVEVDVLPHGLSLLNRSSGVKGVAKKMLSRAYLSRLRSCDAIVVVQHLRDAFRDSLQIDVLRTHFPDKPIILYDLVYLPTIGLWGPWLEPQGNGLWGACDRYHGLSRYDWYMSISTQNRYPMPSGEQPCSRIGIDLNDGSLFPDQRGKFKALVDFEREAYPVERRIQLEALEETGTDYEVLQGHYSVADIRQIYRGCSIYFLAHMESFGLPICELQACGSYIVTPYAGWAEAHWLGEGASKPLSSNFVVYENDKEKLKAEIVRLKAEYEAGAVVQTFRAHHAHFHAGDLDALQNVLDRLGRSEITSRSHAGYAPLMRDVPVRSGD